MIYTGAHWNVIIWTLVQSMAKPNIQELGAKRPLQISFSLIIESVYQYSLLAERPSLLGTFVISSPLPPTAQTNMDMFCFFSAYYSVLLDNYTSGLNTEGDEASSRLYSREEGPAPPPFRGRGLLALKLLYPEKCLMFLIIIAVNFNILLYQNDVYAFG